VLALEEPPPPEEDPLEVDAPEEPDDLLELALATGGEGNGMKGSRVGPWL
jgi:hypothetical protein